MKGINKTVKDLKMEIEPMVETQTEEILVMKNPGKRTGTTDESIINRNT
jgi:hypothetical protein